MASMRKHSVITLIAVIAIAGNFGEINAKQPSYIRGREEANAGEFPYAVSISRYYKKISGVAFDRFHICGGAIISRRHILTAGHCLTRKGNMTVYSGVINLNDKNVISSQVAKIILHPKYIDERMSVRNDIGILELEEDLIFGERVEKIDLQASELDKNQSYVFPSWGNIYPEEFGLKKIPIRLLDETECSNEIKSYFEKKEMLCGYQKNEAICESDSGSPLVSSGRIVGVSLRRPCTRDKVYIYTSVYKHIDWIQSTINDALN